ncbi:hypothetical protein LCGC14_0597170 [marine sediment metagenome]|uniref:Uncharacterized protein n=1 Tax=marine sediment metagenome TaxID=412755 RepID=A0A0F9RGQ4_9ZZZZ
MARKEENMKKVKEYYNDMKKSMITIKKMVEYLNKNDVNFLILSDISSDMRKAKTSLESAVYNYKINRLW